MSPYGVNYRGTEFKNTEALFQWLRFEGYPEKQQILLDQKSPMGVKMKAKSFKKEFSEPEWDQICNRDIENMRLCLKLKVEQNQVLKRQLLHTYPKTIIEDSTKRDRGTGRYWGAVLVGDEWQGENILGKLWMELRSELMAQS